MAGKIIAIGGGDMRTDTVDIDTYAVGAIDRSALPTGIKPRALFLPQASGESKPYTNTFFKVYGSRLKCKADVILYARGEMDDGRIRDKFERADLIYIGGGDYRRLYDTFSERGIDRLLRGAWERGAVIVGNSAGAMCLFSECCSDYMLKDGGDYVAAKGFGLIDGVFCPHYDEPRRREWFDARYAADADNIYRVSAGEFVEFDRAIRGE